MATKHEKTIMAVIQIGINISFILNFCPATGQQYYKNETGKIQKCTCNKFSKVFIRIPGTYKKHLGHTGTETAIFIATKHEKTIILWQLFKLV